MIDKEKYDFIDHVVHLTLLEEDRLLNEHGGEYSGLEEDGIDSNEYYRKITERVINILKKNNNYMQEEPVSEDLEDAINEYSEKERLRKAENESRFFSPADFASGFMSGAKWQKEKDQETIETAIHHAYHNGRLEMKEWMMSKAVDAIPCSILGKEIIYTDLPKEIEVGDEVKVIIIKEE